MSHACPSPVHMHVPALHKPPRSLSGEPAEYFDSLYSQSVSSRCLAFNVLTLCDSYDVLKQSCIYCSGGWVEHSEEGHLPAILGHLTMLKGLTLINCLSLVQAEPGTSISHLAALESSQSSAEQDEYCGPAGGHVLEATGSSLYEREYLLDRLEACR